MKGIEEVRGGDCGELPFLLSQRAHFTVTSRDPLFFFSQELCDASGGLGVTVWGDRIPISHGLWPPDSSDVDIHRPLPPLDVLQNVFCGGEEVEFFFLGSSSQLSRAPWSPVTAVRVTLLALFPLQCCCCVINDFLQFHHVFCVPPEHLDEVLSLFPQGRLTHIGFMTPREKGCRIQSSQDENCSLFFEQLGDTGFTHFSGRDGNCT